jgi:hypothetical protein
MRLVMFATPLPSSPTVMFWQMAVGATVSSTMTSARHRVWFPDMSVTIKVTLLLPMLMQLKFDCEVARFTGPALSELPPSMSAGCMLAEPNALR